MSANFNGLNVQVLDYADAQNVRHFPSFQNGNNKQQIGVYTVDKTMHHLLDSIVNCPTPCNSPPKALSVSTAMDNVLFHRDKFEVFLDARGYAPEEITCTILSQYIEVCAKKRANANELVGRSMSRKYALPQPIIPEYSRCTLTAEGVFVVSAPWKPKAGYYRYMHV